MKKYLMLGLCSITLIGISVLNTNNEARASELSTVINQPKSSNILIHPRAVEYDMIAEYGQWATGPKTITNKVTSDFPSLVYNLVNKAGFMPDEIIKYAHPDYTPEQTAGNTADDHEVYKYMKEVRHSNVQYKEGILDIETIKNEIKNKRPVLVFLNCNGNYWLEMQSCVAIWWYQVVKENDGNEFTSFMTWSLNHTNPQMNSIAGYNDIQLLDPDVDPEATKDATFKWVSTIYGYDGDNPTQEVNDEK